MIPDFRIFGVKAMVQDCQKQLVPGMEVCNCPDKESEELPVSKRPIPLLGVLSHLPQMLSGSCTFIGWGTDKKGRKHENYYKGQINGTGSELDVERKQRREFTRIT